MENYALLNTARLSRKSYLRKADPRADYWFDFSGKKLEQYKTQFGDNFHLIVAGAEDDESDFFVIPFSVVKHMLSSSTVQRPRDRWVGSIRGRKLTIRYCDQTVDVSSYHRDFTRIKND